MRRRGVLSPGRTFITLTIITITTKCLGNPSLPVDPPWLQHAQLKAVFPQSGIPSSHYFQQLNRCHNGETCFVTIVLFIIQGLSLNFYGSLDMSYFMKASHNQCFSSPLQIEGEGTEASKWDITYLELYSKLELQSRTKPLIQPFWLFSSVLFL